MGMWWEAVTPIVFQEETPMTKFVLPLAMAMSIALTCVSFAQTMAPQGGTPQGTMSNTSSDKMTKPDTMGKTDGMKKDEKTDAMKKTDDKTDAMKKDGMSGGMAK
jgi:pentapeptide MXKDX repeat protein